MSSPAGTPPGTPQHHDHFEIDSLNGIDHAKWKVDPTELADFFDNNLSQEQAGFVAELLTKNPAGDVDVYDNTQHKLLVAYLYFLYQNSGAQRVVDIFEKVYRSRFDTNIPNRKFNVSVPRADEIMGTIRSFRSATKQNAKDAAIDKLQEIFAKLDIVCAHYGVTLSPAVAALTNSANLAQDITNITNLTPVLKAFMDFESNLTEKEEAEGNHLAGKISTRPAAEMMVYLCIRQEHSEKGTIDKQLEEYAADDFSQFLVGSTRVDFGGKTAPSGKGLVSALAGYRYDIQQALTGAKEGATGRMSARKFFEEFAILTELSLAATSHEVEHALEKIDAKHVAEIIALIRHEAVDERKEGRGIAEQDLGALQTVTTMLEYVLAQKIAASIKQGDAKDAPSRAFGVASSMLWKQFHHVAADPKKAADHLKTIKPPEVEGGHGGTLKKVGRFAHAFATGTQWLEILGALGQFRFPGKKQEKPEDKGSGGTHGSSH